MDLQNGWNERQEIRGHGGKQSDPLRGLGASALQGIVVWRSWRTIVCVVGNRPPAL